MLGKALLTLSAAGSILGPFIADFNETHVLNPRWPPHAKFHNGQTMSMGLGLGLATLFYTWRSMSSTSVEMARDSLFTAAVFGSMYWVTGLSAILYPGTLAVDPEFGVSLFNCSLGAKFWECFYFPFEHSIVISEIVKIGDRLLTIAPTFRRGFRNSGSLLGWGLVHGWDGLLRPGE